MAADARVIKRYSNRKLYDTSSSQYITLEQIAQLIRAGEEVRVLDNNSKEDLTSVTLAQIIFEEEKRQKSYIPLGAMRQLIQTGGASLQELAQQAQARVMSVFRKGETDPASGAVRTETLDVVPPPLTESAEAIEAARKASAGEAGHLRELVERSQQALEDWQKRVDERVRHMFESLSPFAAIEKEVTRLNQRVAVLEERLKNFTSRDSQDISATQRVSSAGESNEHIPTDRAPQS